MSVSLPKETHQTTPHKKTPLHRTLTVYLPPYSPDPNPIGTVFPKIKNEIRKRAPRTKPECDVLCGECLDWFDERECRNDIRHAGYGPQE